MFTFGYCGEINLKAPFHTDFLLRSTSQFCRYLRYRSLRPGVKKIIINVIFLHFCKSASCGPEVA